MDIRRLMPPGRALTVAASATALAITVAGCGGSSGGKDAVAPQSSGSAATIGVTDGHLVDGLGRTLYLFEADTSSTSTCEEACADAWPPVTTSGDAKATGAVKTSLLGTTDRGDGSTQVTYGGHPLYRYSGDTSPGDMNGAGSEAFGAEWYPLKTSGDALEDEESDSDTSPTPSGGDYSYDY